MPRLALALLIAALLGGCGSDTTETEPAAPAAWGEEALEYFAALEAAVVAGDGAQAAAFYAPTAVIEVVPGEVVVEGRGQIERQISAWVPGAEYGTVQQLFLGTEAAFALRGRVPLWVGDGIEMSSYRITPDGIGLETPWYPATLAARMFPPAAATVADLENSYRDYVSAWNQDTPESMYVPGAQRRDALFGRAAGTTTGYLPGVAASQDWSVGAVTLDEGVAPDLAGPGVLVTPSQLEDVHFYVLVEVGADQGCPVTVLAALEVAGELIATETLHYEVTSLRRCAAELGLAPLPDGWWSGLAIPEPFRYDVTGHLTTSSGHQVTLVNGAVDQTRLVEWALGRFDAAGLAPPAVAEVRFPPTPACLRESGWTVLDPEAYVIEVCADAGAVCADAGCDTFALDVRVAVLHELAHVWLDEHLDSAARSQFLALRRIESWQDESVSWEQRGVEHAAEIVMWGLMDQPVALVRLGDGDCADLTTAYQLLTGSPPPASRCQASSSG